MKRHRVKITGVGFVTPAGIGKYDFMKGIQEPVSKVSELNRFPVAAGPFVGAEIKNFRFQQYFTETSLRRVPRHTQFALVAALLALQDAGLKFSDVREYSPVVVVGASLMDFGSINKTVEMILRKGEVSGLPSSVFAASVSSISGSIAELIGGTTRTLALQSACCAGIDSIGHAAEKVANGEADIAICGGTEAPLFFHPMLELKMAGLSPDSIDNPHLQSRPFDLWRTTGVIGEGACILVLEPESSARVGYSWVEGYAFASDPPNRSGQGLELAIKLALANAGLNRDEVDCISAWGPGHRVIDAAEASSLKQVFGDRLAEIPASSIKGAIGNPLGAAGAIQTGCAAICLKEGIIPPTVNWQYPDPSCPLNLSRQVRYVSHGTSLINSHGLSGTNSCLVLKR